MAKNKCGEMCFEKIDNFIASLSYPKFGAYVVNKLMKHFLMTREEALIVWETHLERKSTP